jgi:predicted MFS family arabinose efflux permease
VTELAQGASTATVREHRPVILMLALACGLAVANIYYSQPLLAPIGAAFKANQGTTALVVTVTQFGYALGLLLLLPLGDLLENRRLAARTLLITAAALGGAAAAPSLGVFLALSVLIGVTSVVAQILIPFAAHLAPEHRRGSYVGTVMTGLLLGILLARTVSSLVAAMLGWRAIYIISCVLMLGVSALLTRVLPKHQPEHPGSYRTVMASIGRLVREEPALRRRAACQALLFGAFSAFWTSVSFELISRHGLNQTGIGVFALVGAAGAAAAPVAGRLGDRGWGQFGSGIALGLAIVAMLLAGFGAGNLILLAAAGVLLDLAVQGHQVFGQREIYGLRANARARINTVYMTTIFVGGSIASASSGVLYTHGGWLTVTLFAAVLALGGLVIWAISAILRRTNTAR